jgi:hypothetical protein
LTDSRPSWRRAEMEIRLIADKGQQHLTIEDTGIGIQGPTWSTISEPLPSLEPRPLWRLWRPELTLAWLTIRCRFLLCLFGRRQGRGWLQEQHGGRCPYLWIWGWGSFTIGQDRWLWNQARNS